MGHVSGNQPVGCRCVSGCIRTASPGPSGDASRDPFAVNCSSGHLLLKQFACIRRRPRCVAASAMGGHPPRVGAECNAENLFLNHPYLLQVPGQNVCVGDVCRLLPMSNDSKELPRVYTASHERVERVSCAVKHKLPIPTQRLSNAYPCQCLVKTV